MKARKSTLIKNNIEVTFINSETTIDLGILIEKFDKYTLKINHISPSFVVKALGGLENLISEADNIANLHWLKIEL